MNPETKDEVVQLYLDDIIPNRFQPREVFDEKALKELAVSIKEHGVIQPIIVRNVNGKYEIIAGERRYKASALAGMTRIPAIIRNLDDKESSKVALLENLQRKNLNPIEEARTYQKILEIDQMTQDELAKTMGKSQSSVANKLRLLSLPDEVQEALLKEQISERHARALLNVTDSKKQSDLLKKVINTKMTVRALEEEINKLYPDSTSSGTDEGSAYTKISPAVSMINREPLKPTTSLPEDQSDYGKITIAPPIGGDMPNMENLGKIINYGEIDQDKLNQQNNTNPRTDYYTTTKVAPVDVQAMQEKAIDIKPATTEPVADLDNLLNINQSFTPRPNSFPNNINENNFSSVKTQERGEKTNDKEDLSNNAFQEDYFKVPDLKNVTIPQIETPSTTPISTVMAQTSNPFLATPTVKVNPESSQDAISKVRNLVKDLEKEGVKVAMDEMDFGDSYQVIIKIDK